LTTFDEVLRLIFKLIPSISEDLKKIKSGEKVDLNQFSAKVTSGGFKPYI